MPRWNRNRRDAQPLRSTEMSQVNFNAKHLKAPDRRATHRYQPERSGGLPSGRHDIRGCPAEGLHIRGMDPDRVGQSGPEVTPPDDSPLDDVSGPGHGGPVWADGLRDHMTRPPGAGVSGKGYDPTHPSEISAPAGRQDPGTRRKSMDYTDIPELSTPARWFDPAAHLERERMNMTSGDLAWLSQTLYAFDWPPTGAGLVRVLGDADHGVRVEPVTWWSGIDRPTWVVCRSALRPARRRVSDLGQ